MKAQLFLNDFFIYSLVLGLGSVLCFGKGWTKLSLTLLFFCSILLGVFIANADPFIHIWDEQFHALVAKNLLDDPLKPILIKEPLFGYNPLSWSSLNIWLHKQPLFLWQIALSLKIFGLTELGVRFPSVMMHAIMIFFIFRCGKIIHSQTVGYYAALFFTFSYFPLEYISGSYSSDHNDIAFLFYSFASLWGLMEYYSTKKKIFILLVGVFSGGAILCKWLTGLLVYGVWMLLIYYNRKKDRIQHEFLSFLISFFICLIIFLPWQIFCLINYPQEYSSSMDFNFKHIIEPLEGHGGNYLFYYNALYEEFGEGFIIPPLILFCFAFSIYFIKNKNNKIILFSATFITYLFFTLVKTKMYGYVFITLPIFTLSLAFTFNSLLEKITNSFDKHSIKKLITALSMLIITLFLFDSNKLYKRHSNKEVFKSRSIKIKEKKMFLTIAENFKNKKCLLFNCTTSLNSHILSIFYTGFPSFNYILPQDQIDTAKKLNYHLIAIDNGDLPSYILENNSIVKIKF